LPGPFLHSLVRQQSLAHSLLNVHGQPLSRPVNEPHDAA
jgi:hypothetical protein